MPDPLGVPEILEVSDVGYRVFYRNPANKDLMDHNLSTLISRVEQDSRGAVVGDVMVTENGNDIFMALRFNLGDGLGPNRISRAIEGLLSSGMKDHREYIARDICLLVLKNHIGIKDISSRIRKPNEEIPNMVDWLVKPLMPTEGISILYGLPGCGKSLAAVACGLTYCSGLNVAGVELDDNGEYSDDRAVLYLDYESTYRAFRFRLDGLSEGLGIDASEMPFHYYEATEYLSSDNGQLKRLIEKNGYTMIIVDSAGRCVPDAQSNVDANRAMKTLHDLYIPGIVTAHTTKGNTKKIYGSIYWEAEARFATYIQQKDNSVDHLSHSRAITKRNDVPYVPDSNVHYLFLDHGKVIQTKVGDEGFDNPEFGATETTLDKIVKILKDKKLQTYAEMEYELSLTNRTIVRSVGEGLKRKVIELYDRGGGARRTSNRYRLVNHDMTDPVQDPLVTPDN